MIASPDNLTGQDSPVGRADREYAFNIPPLGSPEGRRFLAQAERHEADGGQAERPGHVPARVHMAAANGASAMPPDAAAMPPQQASPEADPADAPAPRWDQHPWAVVPLSCLPLINNVDDLISAVEYGLGMNDIIRQTSHLKRSRVKRMLRSRRFVEHLEVYRLLGQALAAREAAKNVALATLQLHRLTVSDRAETARKACMTVIRMGGGLKSGRGCNENSADSVPSGAQRTRQPANREGRQNANQAPSGVTECLATSGAQAPLAGLKAEESPRPTDSRPWLDSRAASAGSHTEQTVSPRSHMERTDSAGSDLEMLSGTPELGSRPFPPVPAGAASEPPEIATSCLAKTCDDAPAPTPNGSKPRQETPGETSEKARM